MASKLEVGKIVATSTPTAWSQAYHAGGFTAVLSVTPASDEQTVDEAFLHKTGKELLDTLIAEYFTLLTKDLTTVKAAVETTVSKVPEGLSVSLVVGAAVKTVLYLVIYGNGRVLLKRGDKTGTLLQLDKADEKKIESVSGYLEPEDMVVLQTQQFEDIVPEHELISQLDHHSPVELAEMIAPKVHESQNGAASALLFAFHEEAPSILQTSITHHREEERPEAPAFLVKETHHAHKEEPEQEEEETAQEEEEPMEEALPHHAVEKDKEQEEEQPKKEEHKTPFYTPSVPEKKGFLHLSHAQKVFLTIAVVLAGVLMASIILFTTRQQEQKQQALFQSVYQPAKTKYDEGKGLLDLNQQEALSDFQSAQSLLSGVQSKFPATSSEGKQITSLLGQIQEAITAANQANTANATVAPDNASPLLSFANKQKARYVTEDTTDFYVADATGISATNKKTSDTKQVIKNNGAYASLGGFAVYLGNFYVLDTKGGITKYAAGSYAKSNYFTTSENANLTNAVSMAIDGSVWVLTSDGTIKKYLRGSSQAFNLSGLSTPLNNPSAIVTSPDDTNLYILDNGNNRLVVVDKTGKFVAQYQTTLLKNATNLAVDEAGKKAYFLSNNTIYQLPLQ